MPSRPRTTPPPPVTLAAVASRAGVHISTVSRALTPGATGVGAATAARIRLIAAEMGYRPDPAAAALRTRRSSVFGVLVPRLTDFVLARIYEGIDATAAEAGYHTFVANTTDDPALRRERLQGLLSRRVDGIILGDARLDGDELVKILASKGIPYVLVSRKLTGHLSVTTDDPLGGRLAAQHLLELGHERVGVVAGETYASTGVERTAGSAARTPTRACRFRRATSCPHASTWRAATRPPRSCSACPPGRRRSLPSTTRPPSGSWARCASGACSQDATWRSWATTTSPWRPTCRCPSRPCTPHVRDGISSHERAARPRAGAADPIAAPAAGAGGAGLDARRVALDPGGPPARHPPLRRPTPRCPRVETERCACSDSGGPLPAHVMERPGLLTTTPRETVEPRSLSWVTRLVSLDTTSRRSNLELIDLVAGEMRRHGLSPQILPNEDGTKANLLVTIRPRTDHRGRGDPVRTHRRRAGRRAGLAHRAVRSRDAGTVGCTAAAPPT